MSERFATASLKVSSKKSSLICTFDVNIVSFPKSMLTLDALRKSLGSHVSEYSEEELITARRDMYQLAYLAYNYYEKNIYNKQIK